MNSGKWSELADVFKQYRIVRGRLRLVPYNPTAPGYAAYQVSLVDDDDQVWTGSQGYTSNHLEHVDTRIVPLAKGHLIDLPINQQGWREMSTDAWTGEARSEAIAIEVKAYSSLILSGSQNLHFGIFEWDIQFKNLHLP